MDYFSKSLTVTDICDKYSISVSTLYSWKELFLDHKKLWLGLLEDSCTSSMKFVDSIFSGTLLYSLEEFFQISHKSFMQGSQIKKAKYNPP
jgi:transposase-like protein